MDLSSCDEGGCRWTTNSCAPVISTWWGWMLWNKKFLCTCHHVMRVDLLWPKNSCAPVITWWGRMSRESGMKHLCAPVITQWGWISWEWKILVHLSSRYEGGCHGTRNSCGPVITWWGLMSQEQKIPVHLSSADEGGCTGTKKFCAPVIRWWGWMSREQKIHVHLSSTDEGGCTVAKNFYGPVIMWWGSTQRLILPVVWDAHFFVGCFDFSVNDPDFFINISFYDSRERARKPVPQLSTALDIVRQVNLFFNTYLIHKDRFSRLRQTDANLLRRVDCKDCPLQTNGHDCGFFAIAIALHFAEWIKLHRDSFLQADVIQATSQMADVFSSRLGVMTSNVSRKCFPYFRGGSIIESLSVEVVTPVTDYVKDPARTFPTWCT